MKTLLMLLLVFTGVTGLAQTGIPQREKILIAEAIRINQLYGEKIWPGMKDTCFAILLVTDDYEYLAYHPSPPAGYELLHDDSLLATPVFYRRAQMPKKFLATLPYGGVKCIIVGTPENTGKTAVGWLTSLLHEHFHQFQTSQPDYFESIDRLGLAGEDKTGGWMLNYPFPYEKEEVITAYEAYAESLKGVTLAEKKKDFQKLLPAYIKKRKAFQAALSQKEYAYFSFQIWQEGLASHTAYTLLRLLKKYKPSKQYRRLALTGSIRDYWKTELQAHLDNLTGMKLATSGRVCFYAAGVLEGILLDRLNPNWRKRYFTDKFFIENYAGGFQAAD